MTVEQVREGPSRGRGSRVGALALALLMGLTACATGAPRGPPLQEVTEAREEAFIAPLPTDFPPVQIGEAELSAALTELVLQLPLRVAQSPRVYSKGVAAVFTVWLWGYLGWEFFELVRAYSHLREEAPRATSFAGLQQVGERFGRVIGPNSVRILVLLGTAAVGGGLGPEAKGPRLPGMAQVARMTRVRLGQGVTQVVTASEQLIVSAPEGTLRLVLAPTVMAMAAGGGSA